VAAFNVGAGGEISAREARPWIWSPKFIGQRLLFLARHDEGKRFEA
jgi:hypothetical protein